MAKETYHYIVAYNTKDNAENFQYIEHTATTARGAVLKFRRFAEAQGIQANRATATEYFEFVAAHSARVEEIIGEKARTMSKEAIQQFFSETMGFPPLPAQQIAWNYTTNRPVPKPAAEPAAPVVEPTAKAAEYVPTEDEIRHELEQIEDEESALRAAHESLWDVETLAEFEEWQRRHPLIGLVRRKDGAKVVAYRVYPHTEGVIEFDLENGRQSWPFYRMIARYFFPICL